MKEERSTRRLWVYVLAAVVATLNLSSSNMVLVAESSKGIYELYQGSPYWQITLNHTNTSVTEAVVKSKVDFTLSNSDANTPTIMNISSLVLTTEGEFSNISKKESDNRTSILPSRSYKKVLVWHVDPNFTMFDFNPYRQFCRWRNGDKKIKERVATREHWEIRRGTSKNATHSLLHIKFDCYQTMRLSPFGTGNWVQMIYLLRLAVAGDVGAKMDLRLSCIDQGREDSLVLPWLMGHFSSEKTMSILSDTFRKAVDTSCHVNGWSATPVGWMVPFIQQDFRRMAISLVGIPDGDHPARSWVELDNVTYNTTSPSALDNPLLPNVEVDDVVIHFRCGDTMTSKETYFRFLKYHEFASRIQPDVESIGIITQPFGKSEQARARDNDDAFRSHMCRRVIIGFQKYLKDRFPRAQVYIRNDAKETVALAYARLIMARKQAFAFPDSSFSVFPTLATFGTGYHLYPVPSPYYEFSAKNTFLIYVASAIRKAAISKFEWMRIPPNQTLFGIESLLMKEKLKNPSDAIFEWFVNDTLAKPYFPEIKRFS